MRENMYEGHWSPFDPDWYKYAFDKFISTADELFNQNEITAAGYRLPEYDGSKSSVFRQEAVLNNSFNEKSLRETLKDIYLNDSHRLMASNHDSTHFYKWSCTMEDVTFIPNTNYCEISLPTDGFIPQDLREKYKLSQYFRKWISIEELLNNWDIFHFNILLFIDKRIYSDYEFRIDDQESKIRFRYFDFWIPRNYSIQVFKFDTNAQCRIKISKELVVNRWNWKMPISYIDDRCLINSNHMIGIFNKISDVSIRTDGNSKVDPLGDNIEFITVEDGYIDLKKISSYNQHMLVTDSDQWIWLTLMVPKFLHEYPILLPTDVIYRPQIIDYAPVKSWKDGKWNNVLTDVNDENKQVYVIMNNIPEEMKFFISDEGDLILEYDGNDDKLDSFIDENGYLIVTKDNSSISSEICKYFFNIDTKGELNAYYTWNDGWKYTIRPIVLADALDSQDYDPYTIIAEDMEHLRQLTIEAADMIEDLRNFIEYEYTTDDECITKLDNLTAKFSEIRDTHNEYHKARNIPLNDEYESMWTEYLEVVDDIKSHPVNVVVGRENGQLVTNSVYYAIDRFHKQHTKWHDFWGFISPLVWIPREFADKYEVSIITTHIGTDLLWEPIDQIKDKQRFRRPVEESDFWTFEYDLNDQVWRPVDLDLEYHFPDVYLVSDPNEKEPTPNRVFKAFLFYSDDMNVREPIGDIVRATPDWDKDVNEYVYDQQAVYRDIYMEKFYWMAVKSIYRGLMVTKFRWECIEYIQDNISYDRFNDLFLKTMDPYVKMGHATYLKSDNYGFPFDDAISKMNEEINATKNGYKQVTNFEMYLNKTWKPSYFDTVLKIDNNTDYTGRLIRRPRKTFDTRRILGTIKNTQIFIHSKITSIEDELNSILDEIKYSRHKFQITLINDVLQLASEIDQIMINCIEFIESLDLDIFDLNDVKTIIAYIEDYFSKMVLLKEKLSGVKSSIGDTSQYDLKLVILNEVSEMIRVQLYDIIYNLGSYIHDFDMETFIRAVNNPAFYDDYDHDLDESLIGAINNFETAWPSGVKEARSDLYASSAGLWAAYNPEKSYTGSEVEKMQSMIYIVRNHITKLKDEVFKCWKTEAEYDQNICDKFEFAEEQINKLADIIDHIIELRNLLFLIFDQIRSKMIDASAYGMSEAEEEFMMNIDTSFDTILHHLSYIAGVNRRDDALEEHRNCVTNIENWISYVGTAKSIFLRLTSISGTPNVFIDVLVEKNALLDTITDYMRTLDREFIPDNSIPTYSSVYNITEIELESGGFLHEVGDMVFVPQLGVYTVSEVDGEIASCISVEDIHYRNTTFRDPCIQNNPYDTITSGDGLGITVKAVSSEETKIINDDVVTKYIDRVKNILFLVERDMFNINPYNNYAIIDTISKLDVIKSDWDHLLSFYSDYMSPEISENGSDMVDSLDALIEPMQTLVDTRSSNDVKHLIGSFTNFIDVTNNTFTKNNNITPSYLYFYNRVNVRYKNLTDYYGNGTQWNDADELVSILRECIYELKLFNRKLLSLSSDIANVNTLYTSLLDEIDTVIHAVNSIPDTREAILNALSVVKNKLDQMNTPLRVDHWYEFRNIGVAVGGRGYVIGDIIELIPTLPRDIYGNEIHDENEEIILNDHLYIRITQVDSNGGVVAAEPLIQYALPYQIWGVYETITKSGHGEYLKVLSYSYPITTDDSILFYSDDSFIPRPHQFDENDLFTFKFENIHDLPIQYEIFFDGKQDRDTIIRHDGNIDTVYLNANRVMDLANAAIYIKGENYFVYKLDSISITDPGAGYYKGQEIYIDSDQATIKAKITELLPGPMKGIKSIEMVENYSTFDGVNPTTETAIVANDSINNIDDEYNNGSYDQIGPDGIIKPATIGLPVEVASFISRRFEKTVTADRNATWMYTDVPWPDGITETEFGDPDDHYYLGTRIDNSYIGMVSDRWNGIVETVPVTDGIIPDSDRVPLAQYIRGEYQDIIHTHIHNINIDIMDGIPDYTINDIIKSQYNPDPTGTFTTHEYQYTGADEIPPVELHYTPKLVDGELIIEVPDNCDAEVNTDGNLMVSFTPDEEDNNEVLSFQYILENEDLLMQYRGIVGVPTVEVDGEIIKAIDISMIRPLILQEVEAVKNPGPYFDKCLVNTNPALSNHEEFMNGDLMFGDKEVQTYASVPQHINEWNGVFVGAKVVVNQDETMGGHRTIYKVRSFMITGYIVYENPIIADYSWNTFDVKWNEIDWYPDVPSLIQQYPDSIWNTASNFTDIEHHISDQQINRVYTPKAHVGTYIHDITIDDISVYNFSEKRWEDLHDESKWQLETNDTGFILHYLDTGEYSYAMRLFLNKTPSTQMKNALQKKNAVFDIKASIFDEVNIPTRNIAVNIGKELRIRKLFPYEQTEEYTLGIDYTGHQLGYEMDFKLAQYMHFKNEIHLEDILVYNVSANRFEDILDTSLFEVRFKDPKNIARGSETNTRIVKSVITDAGSNFTSGEVWGYNEEFNTHIFGIVTADFNENGMITKFTPYHTVNPPTDHIAIEFKLHQFSSVYNSAHGAVIVEYNTSKEDVYENGWIHNVTNPMAPVPNEFKVIVQYDLDQPVKYQIIINKNPQVYSFSRDNWEIFPTFTLPNSHIHPNRIYLSTEYGRIPLINPSNGKPSINVTYTDTDTLVQYLNLYHKYEKIEVHVLPYPIRSVYTQRRVPENGYIDLTGKINKPLNKKYFEFWMNGKLLSDEVTIITPTKLFLHGLKSLRNFEIIEVNRDPNEYFSDNFIDVRKEYGDYRPVWNYNTYLDDALSGSLDGDNYTMMELETLLTPVWKQVEYTHPEYKNYPANVDQENDILVRVDTSADISDFSIFPAFQFSVVDVPTIEGVPIYNRSITWEQMGFKPITEDMIIDMLNEEWKDEIEAGLLPQHTIISDDEWYGMATRMYDEYGNMIHSLDGAAYKVTDPNVVRVNTTTKVTQIRKNTVVYDLD